jgi:predicted nucleic acid-binding protein
MRVAFDTNVLLYAEGADEPVKAAKAQATITRFAGDRMHLPSQVVLEGARALRMKLRMQGSQARLIVEQWRTAATIVLPNAATLDNALMLSFDHGIQIFDAIILATAAQAECPLLLSEDFQDGFVWRGVTVANPFADKLHPLLESAIEG